ncbi:MAG TPA: hypothetical protein VLI93_11005 [Acetobacteraceae bacterium]|nr:hypothetical protein [Acetobacteraceae bacterium]
MADSPLSITMPRMYSDEFGECRFDWVETSLSMKEYAPPAPPVAVSGAMAVSSCVFMRIPPTFMGDQHPTPRKQLIVCLAGAVRFVSSNGASHVLNAGQALIDANTAGPGHTTEVVSDVPFEGFLIALE